MTLDALKLTEDVGERLIEFAVSDHFVGDPGLRSAVRKLWSAAGVAGLTSELWVEGAFPAKVSDTSLGDLASSGEFSRELAQVLHSSGAMPIDRPLYKHQLEAFRIANTSGGASPVVGVSAGTGSGKTEAFLLPLLNHLWRTPAQGAGTRAIVLYPMNALVNDQVDRLYSWLAEQSKISLFHFTSETPEDKVRADQDNVPVWKPARFRTRQQARGLESADGAGVDLSTAPRGPQPDIVITNYSMLEYMLSRPQDAVFFGPALRHIVLDEAHLYAGTLAAEITLLLRRLMMRCGVRSEEVSCYATSATLGGDESSLRSFLGTIFSKPEASVSVVIGQATQAPFDAQASQPDVPCTAARIVESRVPIQETVSFDRTGVQPKMVPVADAEALETSLSVLASRAVVSSAIKYEEAGPALFHALVASPIMRQLEQELWNRKHCSIASLGNALFPAEPDLSVSATVELLRVAAMARTSADAYPLIPHRLHLLVRAPDGLSVCLNPSCAGPGIPTKYGGVLPGARERCPGCDHVALGLRRCDGCGEVFLAGARAGVGLKAAPAAMSSANPRVQLYSVDSSHGFMPIGFSTSSGMLRHISDAGCVPITEIEQDCPVCDEQVRAIRPFTSGAALALPIVAETAVADLPPMRSPISEWLPASGRRMLTFSDSRAEAARLGPRLTQQHETQVVRGALARLLLDAAADADVVTYWLEERARIEEQLASAKPEQVQRQLEQQRAQVDLLIAQASSGGAITDWKHKLSQHPVMAQLMNEDASERHMASAFGQRDWLANEQANRERVLELLSEEFIRWNPNSTTSLEGVCLAEVAYPQVESLVPPDELTGVLPTAKLRKDLALAWPGVLAAILDTVRADGAITSGDDSLDFSFSSRRAPIGRWMSAHDEWGRDLTAFVGKTERHRRRRFLEHVLIQVDPSVPDASELAAKVLTFVFGQLLELAHPAGSPAVQGQMAWLERSDRQTEAGPAEPAFRIRFPDLALRRPPDLFRCRRTGTIWTRSVVGCAPFPGVDGTLEACSSDEVDADLRIGRRRREYLTSAVFETGLWAEEHSAQLSPRENRRLQDLFKAGVRNVLSSTTTLELGIDIGGLNAVLLSNVPPGKASYLQRAGRAGRRADGSSVVITFARSRPFDRATFRNFDTYLSRELRTPVVLLNRERIAIRHLGAYLLGRFFTEIYPEDTHVGAMNAFGHMGAFCGLLLPLKWDAGSTPPPLPRDPQPLSSRLRAGPWGLLNDDYGLEGYFLSFLFWLRDWAPEGWRSDVRQLFADTPIERTANADWTGLIDREISSFATAIVEWRRNYDVLFNAWASAGGARQANAIRYQLLALYMTTVIEALSDNQYLPRYGFPVGLLKLRVIRPDESNPGRVREEDQFRLERSGIMAMREYVPGSEFIVGGKVVTSRGILKHWTGSSIDSAMGLRGRAASCDHDHFFYTLSGQLPTSCPTCNSPLANGAQDLLFPAFGFSTAAWDTPKRGTSGEMVGDTTINSLAFGRRGGGHNDDAEWHHDFSGIPGLTVAYQENGELLVHNRGSEGYGFSICTLCGYADSERKAACKGTIDLPAGFDTHAPVSSTNRKRGCWKQSKGAIRNQWLAAREPTDLLLFDFFAIDPDAAKHPATVLTIALALSRAAAELTDLDPRELGVLCVPTGADPHAFAALIYDNVPGGAGHVQAALEMGRRWLELAREVLFVDAAHNTRCDTACLDCVLEFDVNASSEERLDRRAALQTLDRILGGGGGSRQTPVPRPLPGAPSGDDPMQPGANEGDAKKPQRSSNEERMQRARERRRSS